SRELVATIQDKSERLKVERESQRRVAELKREAQRATSAGGKRETVSPSANSSARGIRVMRDGQTLQTDTLRDDSVASGPEEMGYVFGATRPIVVGDRVKLRSLGSVGIVDSLKGDEAEIRVKSLRMREKLENLELVEVVAPTKSKTGKFAGLGASRSTEVHLKVGQQPGRSELNVIGQTTDEA